ncbi:MAG TPA: GFA family protein [Opitutaceae bacterium]|nr:GFA family protein [Opitutaceae bacterium]
MPTAIEGGCLCGKTRYRLLAGPDYLNDCHCIDCRKSSGAPFVSWGTVERAKLQLLSGELRKIPHANRIRSFAACCGTHLFFEESAATPTLDVTLASLDDPKPFAPRIAIWTEDRLPWVRLDDTRPNYPQASSPKTNPPPL